MISDLEMDLGIFGNCSPLVPCSVSIIDWDWCGGCMSRNVAFFNECSVDGATGASAVYQHRDGDLGKVF